MSVLRGWDAASSAEGLDGFSDEGLDAAKYMPHFAEEAGRAAIDAMSESASTLVRSH